MRPLKPGFRFEGEVLDGRILLSGIRPLPEFRTGTTPIPNTESSSVRHYHSRQHTDILNHFRESVYRLRTGLKGCRFMAVDELAIDTP